jgi:hypothetical protein
MCIATISRGLPTSSYSSPVSWLAGALTMAFARYAQMRACLVRERFAKPSNNLGCLKQWLLRLQVKTQVFKWIRQQLDEE